MIQNLLPVMRELGLVNIFWDVNFGNVQTSLTRTAAFSIQRIHGAWTSLSPN
jgi:hypothetical protein